MGQATANPQITVEKMSTTPQPLEVGNYAEVKFKVINDAPQSDAEQVNVSFMENYPFSVDPDERKSWRIASMEAGDSYTFRMQFRVDPNALENDEEYLKFRTSTGTGSRIHRLPVDVEADKDGLVVGEVTFPDKVAPGTSNKMTLRLENLANTHYTNIQVSLAPGKGVPAVVDGVSSRQVERIRPGEEKSVSFHLSVDGSAENGVYSIPIELTYENAGQTITRTASTGIVVGGEPEIEMGVNSGGDIPSGSTGTVTFRFVNRGQGTAKFTKIEFRDAKGYRILSGKSVYLGDMNPDDYQTAELEVYASENISSAQIPVQITYKKDGMEKTVKRTAEINVLTPQEREIYSQGGGGMLLPAAVVVVLLIAGIIYWRRR